MNRNEQRYDMMEGRKYGAKRTNTQLSPFFLRKPYSGTVAETKDNTQERLHEYDYRKV